MALGLVRAEAGYWVHPSAVIDEGAQIGEETRIWHFCHVMGGARLGRDGMLGQNCFVAGGVRVGDRVRIQNNVSLYDGVELEEDVFCGPSVVFTNVRAPRAFISQKHAYARTVVKRGATLGANATILPGAVLGEYSFVGAGAVVSKEVPAFALVVGVPQRVIGWMSRAGEKLEFRNGEAVCGSSGDRYRERGGRVTLEHPGELPQRRG